MKVPIAVAAALVAAHSAAAGQTTSIHDFVSIARGFDIVILGEIHDNPEHHAKQREIVAALQPAALVFEMIPQADEAEVNALREDGAARHEIAEALDWQNSGWPDFDYYAPILEAAPVAQIFGAAQPEADVREAIIEGAAAAFGPDAGNYGLDLPLAPEEEAAREARQAEAHCGKLPVELLAGMVEAQRFRDAGLADAALWARTTTGGQVVVITGSGHADKRRGMPAALAVANADVSVVSLGQFEAAPADTKNYDAYMISPAPAREDPCATFDAPKG